VPAFILVTPTVVLTTAAVLALDLASSFAKRYPRNLLAYQLLFNNKTSGSYTMSLHCIATTAWLINYHRRSS